jgi:hypothetical protein
MLITRDLGEARRFTHDVKHDFNRYKRDIPNLQLTKLYRENLFIEVFVFWYIDNNQEKFYIQS